MSRKIITKGKYQWNDKTNQFDTVYEDSFDYDGDIAYAAPEDPKAPDGKKMGKDASDDFDDAFKPTFKQAGDSLRKKIKSEGKKAALGLGGSFAAAITTGAQVAFDTIEATFGPDFDKIINDRLESMSTKEFTSLGPEWYKGIKESRDALKDAAIDMTQVLEGGLTGASDSFDIRNAAKEFGVALEKAGFSEQEIKDRLAPILTMADSVELKTMEKNFTDSLESSVMAGLGFIPKNAFTEALGMDEAMKTVTKKFADRFKKKGAKIGQWMAKNWKKALAIGVVAGIFVGIFKGLKTIVTGFSGLVDKLGTQFGVVGVQAADAVSPLQTNLLAARTEAIGFGKDMDDVIGITTGLSDEFGISIDKASDLAGTILDSSTAMGLSVDEGAKLFGTLMKIGKLTQAQAEDLAESTYNLAVANKVNPAAVMKDIADNTEVFAKFGGKGSKNIMQAAVQAKKLGISLSDVASIAENLLDFESSIEAELEASMMLGRRINMGEARRLAMTGDLEGMMNEVVKQAGGLSQWNELDIFQRKSLAKLAGTDLATMGKLVAEKARLASLSPGELDKELKAKETMSTMTELMSKFKQMGASLIVNIGAPLEALFKSFSGWLTTVDEKGTSPFQRIGQFVTDIGKNIGGWVKSIEVFFTKNEEGESGFTEMLEKAKGIAKEIIFWAKLAAGFVIISKTIQFIWAATSAVQKVMNSSQKKMNVLSGIWSAIMTANPIGLIVVGIAALIAGIILVVKHWDKVKPAIMAIWETIKKGVAIIFNSVLKPFKDAWKTITGLFSGDIGIVDAIKGIAGAVLDWITWPFRTAMNLIGAIFGIESLGEKIIQPIKDVFGAGVDWVTEKFTTLKEWFGGFGEKIKNVFSGIKDFIGDLWGSVLDILKAPFNLITKGINFMIRGINSIKIQVPDWVPLIGGKGFKFNIPEIPTLQTEIGEGWEITGGGLGVLHKEEAVGTFNFDPIIAEIRAQKAQLAKPPEIDFTGLVVEMKAMSAKLDAGNMIAEKQITKQEELHGFGGTATKAQGREFANQISRFGG